MTTKFITQIASGVQQLVDAITAFTGTANEIIATNGSGFIDSSLIDPNTLADTVDVTVATGNTLVAGDFVSFTGAGEVELADNTAYATRAQGFVLAGFAAGATATVYKTGTNTSAVVTDGTDYFLGTAGAETATNPAFVVGTISQTLGYGSTDGLVFEYNPPIEYAAQP